MPFEDNCFECEYFGGANREYQCRYCDYGVCKECFDRGESRGLGHPLRRKNVSLLAPSQTALDTMDAQDQHGNEDIEEALEDQPVRLCCYICCNYTPEFLRRRENTQNNFFARNNRWKLNQFSQAAEKGCMLCSIIYRGAKAVISADVADEVNISLEIQSDRMVTKAYLEDHSILHQICFRGNPAHLPSWNDLEPKELLCRNFRDERCFDKIKQWLTVCTNTHEGPRCRQSVETPLPRRLVAIKNTADRLSLALELTNGETGRYIALSHCWGGYTGCQTTTANIASRTSGIDYDSLPQTFKDAIYCALQFDVSYIWIDSLCIIQDDTEDWESESAKMCGIYSDAYFVLAAASANADTDGFLTEPSMFQRGFGLASDIESGKLDLTVYDDMHLDNHPFSANPRPVNGVNHEPLNKRAWTLQETLLARRCIIFGRHEVSWQCESAGDCECGGDANDSGISVPSGANDWRYFTFPRLQADYVCQEIHPHPLGRMTDMESTFRAWRQLVVPNYTARGLTVSNDKLPALSGVAEKIARSFEVTYLAGIWLDDVKYSLAWTVREPHDKPRQSPYLGPSFSWVSVDDEIVYRTPGDTQDDLVRYGDITIKAIDYDMSLSGRNPYGSVEGGWVKLSALSHPLRLRWGPDAEDRELTGLSPHQPLVVDFHPDTMLCGIKLQDSDGKSNILVQRAASKEEGIESFDTLVIGLLLFDLPDSYRFPVGDQEPVMYHEIALLVLSASATAPDMFQRIGFAALEFELEVAERWIQSAEEKDFTIM